MRTRIYQLLLIIFCGIILPYIVLRFALSVKNQSVPEVAPAEKKTGINVLMSDKRIVEMDIEDYVTCVVLAEMPASFEYEALKAQSVLARTYALKRIGTAKHDRSSICTDAGCCQGYCDPSEYSGSEDNLSKVRSAVKETESYVLTYQGTLVEATYFSCSGGCTEDAIAVWGSDVPYLKSKPSPGEEGSAHFASTKIMSQQECLRELGLSADSLNVSGATYTRGGGVQEIMLSGVSFNGVTVRQLLGLPSTAFQIRILGDSVIITSKGYGHRVGMSQYGANAMAKDGADYRQILAYYFEGTILDDKLP